MALFGFKALLPAGKTGSKCRAEAGESSASAIYAGSKKTQALQPAFPIIPDIYDSFTGYGSQNRHQ